MIKRYCDLCNAEMTGTNVPNFNECNPRGRLEATLTKGNASLTVEVITGFNGVSNRGDFCVHCIIDALNKLDDRPKVESRPKTPTPTRDRLVPGRYFIFAPSTGDSAHYLHGQNVIATPCEDPNADPNLWATIHLLNADECSRPLHRMFLRKGWCNPTPVT